MHPQWLFLLYIVSNSGKRYWDCKLRCIEAQRELSSTFVYDQKMSTSGSSARNSHLSQGGRMTMMPMSVSSDFSFAVLFPMIVRALNLYEKTVWSHQNLICSSLNSSRPWNLTWCTLLAKAQLHLDKLLFT